MSKGVEIELHNIEVGGGSLSFYNTEVSGVEVSYVTLDKLVAASVSEDCKRVNIKIIVQELDTKSRAIVTKVDLQEKARDFLAKVANLLDDEEEQEEEEGSEW